MSPARLHTQTINNIKEELFFNYLMHQIEEDWYSKNLKSSWQGYISTHVHKAMSVLQTRTISDSCQLIRKDIVFSCKNQLPIYSSRIVI